MDSESLPKTLSAYPPVLREEIELLRSLRGSMTSMCVSLSKLKESIETDDRELGKIALFRLYDERSGGVSAGWKEDFEQIRHLIEAVAQLRTIQGPILDFFDRKEALQEQEKLRDVAHDKLVASLQEINSNSVQSAHEAVIKLWRDVAFSVYKFNPDGEGLSHAFVDARWEDLKHSLAFLLDIDFEELGQCVKTEYSASVDYARKTSLNTIAIGPDTVIDDDESQPAGLESLNRAQKQAWASWKLAERNHDEGPSDRQAFHWLGEQSDDMFIEDLVGYELPDYPTWARYVHRAGMHATRKRISPGLVESMMLHQS